MNSSCSLKDLFCAPTNCQYTQGPVGMTERRIELFPFRFWDPLRQRWINARYLCTLDDLRRRYERFEIVGKPEIRFLDDNPLVNSASHLQSPRR